MKRRLILAVFLICLFPHLTEAQNNKTRILILGTTHLQQIKEFEKPMLDEVILKLDTFNFDVICIEKMPGELLNDIASRNDNSFDELTKGPFGAEFLALADTVQKAMNITFTEAQNYILAQAKKRNFTPAERKELLFYYLAVTDLPSAVLQYVCIGDYSVFTTEFEKYIAAIIEKKTNGHNEYYSLAVPLAKKENINKLEPIDNFQDEALLLKYYPEFITDYTAHSEELNRISELPVYQKSDRLLQEGIRTNDLSELYTYLNSDEYKQQDYEGQWAIWLKTDFSSGSDRARYSLWEMRNLQIAANIMNVAARNPGKRILVIIGASHKGFLEKYLRQTEDVEVLQYN